MKIVNNKDEARVFTDFADHEFNNSNMALTIIDNILNGKKPEGFERSFLEVLEFRTHYISLG